MTGWLTGWKAIAGYMGLSVKTCKVWRKEYGLPVRSLPGGKPVCLPGELDLWLVNYDNLWKKHKSAPRA